MYDVNEIVAMLKSGSTSDEIAEKFVQTLNEAQNEINRQKEEDEKKSAAAQIAKDKADLMCELYLLLGEYLSTFYPGTKMAKLIDITKMPEREELDELVKQLDSIIVCFNAPLGDLDFMKLLF